MEGGENVTEVLFSGGAGAMAYQMGFAQAMLEIIGKEKLKKCQIGGISCGNGTGISFLNSIYSNDYDMKHYYNESGRKFYEQENKKFYGFFTSGDLIFEESKSQWEYLQSLNVPDMNEKFHLYVTDINGGRPQPLLIDKFKDSEDFGEATRASSMLPMIAKFGLYVNYRGKKCIDGGLSMPIPYKYKKSKKIFINVLPITFYKWPFNQSESKVEELNLTTFNIYEDSKLVFPIDYWIWKEKWSDEMFLKGYFCGIKQKEKLVNAFN